MLISYLQKAIKITNDNFVVVLPLVAFYIILHLYMILMGQNADTGIKSIIVLLTVTFMIAVFVAGWLYMIKQAVDLSKQEFVMDEEAVKAHLGLLKDFPVGVGKFFLSFVGQIVVGFILLIITTFFLVKLGINLFGIVDFSPEQIAYFSDASRDMTKITDFIKESQINTILKWGMLFFGATFLISYLVMFWAPEIIYKTTNPLKAFIESIVKLFKNPLKSFGLYVLINVFYFILSIIVTLTANILVLYYFFSIVSLYFVVYVVVLIFTYFEGEFVGKNEED